MSILRTNQITNTAGNASPNIPGGVLQVKQDIIDGNSASTASTSFVASPVTGSITPLKATSKVLVRANFTLYHAASKNTFATLYRGSTDLAPSSPDGILRVYNTSGGWQTVTIEWLDEPNTTSATTYTVYYKVSSGSTGYINAIESLSTMTFMEIGG